MYGYLNGGQDAFAADRALAAALRKIFPGIGEVVRENRVCVNWRVPGYLARQGFRQFLDLGCGMPVEPLLHESVKAVTPCARVVYVDQDPHVVVHGRALYRGHGLAMVEGDAADVYALLDDPDVREILDPDQPVAVVAGALMHFMDDHEARGMVDDLAASMAAGSVLVFSHVTGDDVTEEDAAAARDLYEEHVGLIFLRSESEILDLLGERALLAGLCRTYELLPEHPDDVALARQTPAPHFYAGILELSPDPVRGTTIVPSHEGTPR
ncbi:SAM-dependent methyltransferase [Nonomuraea maheshkhaliensis]|uniref:SAM-dependent methyltransferase n=1 Tax=Nonomuraea maheshkhaliensis TaxID=419590 RepID=A0ABP4QMU6_9ACTN